MSREAVENRFTNICKDDINYNYFNDIISSYL